MMWLFSFPWPLIAFLFMIIFFGLNILYEESPKFRYKFKFVIYVVYVSTWTFITMPLFLLKPKNVVNIHWTAPFIRSASRLLGIQWDIHGHDILERDEPCVIICNHQSILDILGMAEIWPYVKKCAVVAKKEILYVFPFGLGAWLCGTVFINRSDSSKSRVQIDTTAEALQQTRTKLWIFPEGTRHKGPSLLPFKKGAFHIAVQYKIPIIPIIISPYVFINDEKPFFNSGKMVISVLSPIETRNCDPSQISELVETTRDKMTTEYQRLAKLVHKMANILPPHPGTKNGGPSTPLTIGLAEMKKHK